MGRKITRYKGTSNEKPQLIVKKLKHLNCEKKKF